MRVCERCHGEGELPPCCKERSPHKIECGCHGLPELCPVCEGVGTVPDEGKIFCLNCGEETSAETAIDGECVICREGGV
jgi:hypothetical protein